jgi:hypothetical protein
MGNPTITRLGKTQFWYKNWYSDFYYSKSIKKYRTFENLLNVYFKYGLFKTNNLLFHNFWYKNNQLKVKNNSKLGTKKSLYFRKYYYAHETLTIEHSYFIRLRTPEYFPLKLYIIHFNNWVIASIQWFKPIKKVSKLNSLTGPKLVKYERYLSTRNKGKYVGQTTRTRILFKLFLQQKMLQTVQLKYVF